MATDAAELEVQPHQLKRLGRWKSIAYQTYIDQRTQDLRQIRKRLAALKQKLSEYCFPEWTVIYPLWVGLVFCFGGSLDGSQHQARARR
jgi:hypothetical protein